MMITLACALAEKSELPIDPKGACPGVAFDMEPMVGLGRRLVSVEQLQCPQAGLNPIQFARLPNPISVRNRVPRIQVDRRPRFRRRSLFCRPADADELPENCDPQRFGERAVIEKSFLMLVTASIEEPAENRDEKHAIKAD